MTRIKLSGILTLLLLLMPLSCNDDNVQNEFSSYRAYFYFDQVMTTHPLLAALTGAGGQFCSIYSSNSKMIFQSLTEMLPVDVTAIAYYQRFVTIGGFIVGQSNVPDMKTGQLPIVCYDRVCPNCYKESSISKPLVLQENGFANCQRCKRNYDLNNLGITPNGNKLIRYKISYNGNNVMEINN